MKLWVLLVEHPLLLPLKLQSQHLYLLFVLHYLLLSWALAQKMIITKCNIDSTFVITATQMLESMCANPLPTCAEMTDVANAVFDGTDAVMLSIETVNCAFPDVTVKMMAEIDANAELGIDYYLQFLFMCYHQWNFLLLAISFHLLGKDEEEGFFNFEGLLRVRGCSQLGKIIIKSSRCKGQSLCVCSLVDYTPTRRPRYTSRSERCQCSKRRVHFLGKFTDYVPKH
jgi:hypothetical protein